jgi:hypothetical protein
MAGIFGEPVGLSGCNRLAIYNAWGREMQQAYPAFKDYSCSYCGRIASPSITLASDVATGMVSRIGVTVNTATLSADTVLADLQAAPVTPFAPVPFAPAAAGASKAASGNLPSTGDWNVSFTLITNNKPEQCPLPVQSISCMPTFVGTPSGGCECPPGYQNANGVCTSIVTPCGTVTMSLTAGDSAPRGTVGSVITASISQPPGVAAKIIAVPKHSAVDVAPNIPATLPATGDWSVTLSVGDQLCTTKTQLVTVRCAAGFVDVDGQCSCPVGSENVGGKCVAKQSLCAKSEPRFSLSASSATGTYANLRVSVSSDLPFNTTVELVAVPQNATVKVPPFQPASAGSAILPSTGSWSMQLSVDGEPCTGLPPLTVTCLPGFIGTPCGGCECPSGEKNIDGKCEPITDKPKTACEVATFLPSTTQLTDNTTVSLGFSDGRDPSQVTVLMRPKVAVRTVSASNPSALLGLGRVVPGEYEIELAEGDTRCTLSSSVSVGCSPGYSPAGGIDGVCISANKTCSSAEWVYGTSCLQKAEMTVQASSAVLEITVVKSRNTTIGTATAELRLKSGDVKYDTYGHQIKWTASLDASKSWLTLHSNTGFVHSGKPVADVIVTADSAGLNDTAQSGPLITSITFRCEPAGPGMTTSDFANGTEVRTIELRLTIKAVPYVSNSHVVITRNASGQIVQRGEPVEAGDRLTVSVKAVDADGLPISRRDLQLTVEVRGKLNRGGHSAPLEPDSAGTNVYTATIPENWIKEPETVESDVLPSSVAAATRLRHPLLRVPAAFVRFDSIG